MTRETLALHEAVNKAVGMKCVFEDRPQRYLFGALNYGDIPGTRNAGDGDPWDVVAPGLGRRLPFGKPYTISKVLGMLVLENGNTKLAVRLRSVKGFDAAEARAEMRRYARGYMAHTGVKGTLIM